MTNPVSAAEQVLHFWFEETPARLWFARDGDFDALVRQRFETLTLSAMAGGLSPWAATAAGGLALVLLLDQFPRQIWREQPLAFAGDAMALALTQQALDQGWVQAEPLQARRQFWLMPLMHAEDLAVQEAALPLFRQWVDPRTADFAERHCAVIARFGRFPHRNAVLGRQSTCEELAFLETPGSRF